MVVHVPPSRVAESHGHQHRRGLHTRAEGNVDQNGEKQYDNGNIVYECADKGSDHKGQQQGDARADLPKPRQHPSHRFQRPRADDTLPGDHQGADGNQRLMSETTEKVHGV